MRTPDAVEPANPTKHVEADAEAAEPDPKLPSRTAETSEPDPDQ